MEVEVIEVLDIHKICGGVNIKVKAKTKEDKLFDYIFIKTNLEESTNIKKGFKWFMNCEPKIYKNE